MFSMAWSLSTCGKLILLCWIVIWGGTQLQPSGKFTRQQQLTEISICRSELGFRRGQSANLLHSFQRLFQLLAKKRQFFCTHQLLEAFEELTFFLADVAGESLAQLRQIFSR